MIRLTFFICLGQLFVFFNLLSCETPNPPENVYTLAPMDKLYKGKQDYLLADGKKFVLETTPVIIEKFKYECETIKVVTGDKYTIRAFRIIKRKDQIVDRPVVLIMHGMMGSSSDFVFAGEESALGFHLFEKGYDVWLGNFRGNVFSGLEYEEGKFWDFSFHEMGEYDLPALIDRILEITEHESLSYIGFSMGTTASYVMLSLKPEYNGKINKMISISPVVYTDASASAIPMYWRALLGLMNLISSFGKVLNTRVYKRNSIKFMRTPKCYREDWKSKCEKAMNDLSANSSYLPLYDAKLREDFLKITPVGGSWKTLCHFAQVYKTGVFAPYNHREEKRNRKDIKAGTTDPPPYDLSKVKIHILLLIGKRDKFCKPKNIQKLISKLTNAPVTEIHVEEPEFKHADFFVAKGLNTLVFPHITKFLDSDNP